MEDIPLIPVVYAERLVALMQEEGLETDSLLRESGVSPRLLQRPEAHLTLRQSHALVSRYMGLSSHPLPALRYGQRLDLLTHGLLGHVYCWRGDFRSLITGIAGYLQVRLPVLALQVVDGGEYFGIRIDCAGGSAEARRFLLQAVIGSFHTLCRVITPDLAILCRHDLFRDAAAARALLQAPLNTDHDGVELRFYARAGDSPSPQAGRSDEPARSDPYEEPAFVVRLRNELMARLRGGDSADEIASALGMSVRTLRRRLADSGLNFNKVRLDVRMQVAQRYLTTTHMSIERIAGLVGYSDQASFTRAFREWRGETPAALRQQRVRHLTGAGAPAPAAVPAEPD